MNVPTKPPTFHTLDWAGLVRRVTGEDIHQPDPSYVFSNESRKPRVFEDSGPNSGIYSGTHG